VASQESADQAIKTIVEKDDRLDVVIHNAGRMVFGAAEAFTPEELLQVYDTNVLSTQRVNRAPLPQLRKQKKGLVLWVGSTGRGRDRSHERPLGGRRQSPTSGSHRTQRADFPHWARQTLIHSMAIACSSL
jgi:NADP-dependent 3-hydroxy acid dehydrogenase YdfG